MGTMGMHAMHDVHARLETTPLYLLYSPRDTTIYICVSHTQAHKITVHHTTRPLTVVRTLHLSIHTSHTTPNASIRPYNTIQNHENTHPRRVRSQGFFGRPRRRADATGDDDDDDDDAVRRRRYAEEIVRRMIEDGKELRERKHEADDDD